MEDFLSIEHKIRFKELLRKARVDKGDTERSALFYVISGNIDLYKKVNYIYNFKDNCIEPDVLENSIVDFCSSSISLIKLAFNLFNGYATDQTILSTFNNLDDNNFSLALRAIAIRFGRTI